jgi:apolipoprotein N-acyltransferase
MWFMGEDGGNRRPPDPVRAAGTRIGALLGVDNEDAGVARGLVAAGAGLLASSTHDWEQLSLHQRAHVRLNATATATPLIRADWRFGSMVADTDGREVASAPPGQARAVVTASVRSGGTTPYVTVGDAAGWISLAVVALLAGLGVARRARRA